MTQVGGQPLGAHTFAPKRLHLRKASLDAHRIAQAACKAYNGGKWLQISADVCRCLQVPTDVCTSWLSSGHARRVHTPKLARSHMTSAGTGLETLTLTAGTHCKNMDTCDALGRDRVDCPS